MKMWNDLKQPHAWLVVAFAVMISGCLTPKNLDKAVSDHYVSEFPGKPKKTSDDILISSPLNGSEMMASNSTKKTSHFLPLIFYWSWNLKHICNVNPTIPVNNFSKTVLAQSNKGLRQKLNGQSLELSVDSIPNVFTIDDKAHIVWIVYAFSWDRIAMVPDNTDLVVTYRLKQGGTQTRQGIIRVANNSHSTGIGMFKNWRTATFEYLDEYNQRITAMSKSFVNQLLTEL